MRRWSQGALPNRRPVVMEPGRRDSERVAAVFVGSFWVCRERFAVVTRTQGDEARQVHDA